MCETHRKISLGFAHEDFDPGLHICQIINDDEERTDAILRLISSGLSSNENVACFSDGVDDALLEAGLSSCPVSYYRMFMGISDYGALRIETVDPETLAAYDPYLKNFAFMISVILEERRQRAENEESRLSLESRVHERTAQLEEALRTRDVLLQELFHRTRNSMQLISSLLDIEASYREDAMVKAALRDMKSRVSAIALAHSKLYVRKDLSRIAAADYLQGLVDLVWDGYAELSDYIENTIDVGEDILLLIDTAVPLGIVVVETVSNALKFAFGERGAGSLAISLKEVESGKLSLTIADDGVGFPQGFDYRRDGKMGLQNVIAIIENQLNGTISVDSGPGVRWRLEFWGDLYAPRI